MKTAVLIDGANLAFTVKMLKEQNEIDNLDYAKLQRYFEEKFNLLRIYYYTAQYYDEEGHNELQGVQDWLEYNGFTLVKKRARKIKTDNDKGFIIKGNMDIEIAVDALTLARQKQIERIVLMTGDSDFAYLVKELQNCAIKVDVVSSMKTKPVIIGDELRRQADQFIELADLIVEINLAQQKG